MKRSLNVSVVGVGCRVNRAENEALSRALQARGFELCDVTEATLVVLNTCCVTGEAQAKTRKALRRYSALPQVKRVVAYGCAAALFASELAQTSSAVRVVSRRDAVVEVVEALAEELTSEDAQRLGALSRNPDEAGPKEFSNPTANASWRLLSGGKARPTIKIQDGCGHRCSYCVVWQARGPSRSLDPAQVVREVAQAHEAGFGEVVLCGVDLGAYEAKGLSLAALLDRLLQKTAIGRLRLSSLEPHNLTDVLIDVIASSQGRIAPYLALPLQSGCEATLERMGRPLSARAYAERVEAARAKIPHVAIAADLICGFPGETEAEWRESLAFCEAMAFASMHVFRFSPRPHTPALRMVGAVPPPLAKRRSQEARALAQTMRQAFVRGLVGTEQRVLVESPGVGSSGALVKTYVESHYAPRSLICVRPQGLVLPDILDAREDARCVYDGGGVEQSTA